MTDTDCGFSNQRAEGTSIFYLAAPKASVAIKTSELKSTVRRLMIPSFIRSKIFSTFPPSALHPETVGQAEALAIVESLPAMPLPPTEYQGERLSSRLL